MRCRHGEVSQTMGSLPRSEAASSASSSLEAWEAPTSRKPRESMIMPQQAEEMPSGMTTSYPAFCMSEKSFACTASSPEPSSPRAGPIMRVTHAGR